MLMTACGSPLEAEPGEHRATTAPLPELPTRDALREDGKVVIRVVNRRLVDFEGHLTRIPSGPQTLKLYNDVPGADVSVHGLDLRHEATALWLRGRGAARHWLPQWTTGQVNGGVGEDFEVDLPPGDYVLTETMDGVSEVVWLVR
jgi:hypothetical protein